MLDIHKTLMAAGVVVLEISGRIRLGLDCEQIEAEVDELVRAGQPNAIFDLTNVRYMDSTGVGTLVRSFNKLKNAGGQLRLAGKGGAVDVIKLTQTNAIVPTHDSVDEALAAFTSH
jgi:anti-sigma B factor antagonist